MASGIQSREIQFQCEACGKLAYVQLPYAPSPETRQRIIKAALDEHRASVCTSAPEAGRTFRIWYPRA